VSVVRGAVRDYTTRHPGPEDVALVVEVTRSSVAKDRALALIACRRLTSPRGDVRGIG